jgi:DNA-binding NarL/FixJ family response regulator
MQKAQASHPEKAERAEKKRVFLVDDHDVVRFGISQLVNKQSDLAICGEAASVNEALDRVRALEPDLAVIDITLKGSNGLELVKTMRSECPKVALLVLSMHDESIWAEVALRAGAMGYLMKENSLDFLLPAIRKVLTGNIYLSEALSSKLLSKLSSIGTASPIDLLSDRELQVLQMLSQWKNSRQIAAELNLSVKTVDYYKENIKDKLKLNSGAELIQFALNFFGKTS